MRIRKSLRVLLQVKMLKEKWKRAWAWISQVEDYTPEVFVKSQWQWGETSTLYLLYRWMLAGAFVCGMIASILDVGRDRHLSLPTSDFSYFFKWLIYLTNWGFTTCTIQAIMSTIHVTKHYVKMRHNHDTDSGMGKMKKSYMVYWVLHTIAVIGAIVISTIYWAAVYNPECDSLDAVNLIVHLFNSVGMILDLWIVAHPIKLFHCYWVFAMGCTYCLFNYFYFLAGGTARSGDDYIYKIMNWRRPLEAVIAVVFTVLFGAVVTVFVWLMSIIRRRLGNCFHKRIAPKRNMTENAQTGPRIV